MNDLAVLTGDIIRSRDLTQDELAAAFDGLAEAAQRFERLTGIPARLTRTRGDGWQMVTSASFALRAMLTARARLRLIARHVDSRIAVGVGAGRMPGETLADADGPAFIASGRRLDSMKRGERLAMVDPPSLGEAIVPLLQWISDRWTGRQAEIAWIALDLPARTIADIARKEGVEAQSLHDVWSGAGLDPILNACVVWEKANRSQGTQPQESILKT